MLKLREDLVTEFKRQYTDDIRLSVLAFVNTSGGTLYVGIEDDGTVCGVHDPDAVILRIQNTLRDAILPDVMMSVNCTSEEVDGKTVVKVEVHRGVRRPYFLRSKGIRPEGVYVRQGPSSVPADFDAIRRMIIESSHGGWDQEVAFEQTLTFDYTREYFSQKGVAFGPEQMQTLGLINGDKLFTNLAFLLSDQCPCTLKAAVFQGTRKTLFRSRVEFTGSVLKQMEDAHQFLLRFNDLRSTIDGRTLSRVDTLNYPLEAVREGLVNAVVHRDYSSSAPTLISIFHDRMELLNQGGLLPNMSVEEIRRGVSKQRNEGLAAVFYRLKVIEAYGTGYDRIDAGYEASGMSADISVTPYSFLLTLPNINYGTDVRKPTASAPAVMYDLLYLQPSKEQLRIQAVLDLCSSPAGGTRQEIQEKLGLSQSSVINLLRSMTEKGLLVKIGNGRAIHYKTRTDIA